MTLLILEIKAPHIEAGDSVAELFPALVALEYWREYRTMFHIGISWGISEASVLRIITKVEDILSHSKEFSIPTKRRPDLEPDLEVVVVDVAESPIERPKKTKALLFGQENAAHDKNAGAGLFEKPAHHRYALCKGGAPRFFAVQAQPDGAARGGRMSGRQRLSGNRGDSSEKSDAGQEAERRTVDRRAKTIESEVVAGKSRNRTHYPAFEDLSDLVGKVSQPAPAVYAAGKFDCRIVRLCA
ncbi:MAG: transposase family protein [Acidobacteria bacterium]|nr:transposase family protein [Acidobacteriota bacterium]